MGRPNDGNPLSHVGRLIRGYRKARGMTQLELARAAGTSVGALRDLEQGRTQSPRWETVEELAAALAIGPDQRADLIRARRGSGPAGTAADVYRPRGGAHALSIGVLGPLTVKREGVTVALGPARQRAVLGLLALCRGTCLHRDAIIDALWAERPPASAVAEVQGYVSRLRQILAPRTAGGKRAGMVTTIGANYRLETESVQLDTALFEQLGRRGREMAAKDDPMSACELYERALELWRGETLADIELLRQHPAAIELTCRRTDLVIQHAETAARGRSHPRALPLLRDLCAREPYNEQAHAHLMVALAATGQQAAALQMYGELRQRLATELGIRPSPQLAQAHARVLSQQIGSA